ncbi:MAG: phosphoribosylformylglycinamidine synthase subunit PurL, partial [Rhizobium oryzihabitans]
MPAKRRIFLSHDQASCGKEPETFLGSNRVRPMSISNSIKITPELVASHGLKPDEYQRILDLIGREPSFTELGIFSAMWNEHCS